MKTEGEPDRGGRVGVEVGGWVEGGWGGYTECVDAEKCQHEGHVWVTDFIFRL